jgi:hypothetical protein
MQSEQRVEVGSTITIQLTHVSHNQLGQFFLSLVTYIYYM